MATPFDPTRAVRFDLPKGSIHARVPAPQNAGQHAGQAGDGVDQRMVLVPIEALDEVANVGGMAAASAVGHVIGMSCGKRAAVRLGGRGLGSSTLEDVVTHLGGELSLVGVGSLVVERWGRAMVMAIERSAVKDDRLLAAIVEGALREVTGREVHCTTLVHDGTLSRVLVASRGTAERVRQWLTEGTKWSDVLARLQKAGGAA
jgi:hypothetical protein